MLSYMGLYTRIPAYPNRKEYLSKEHIPVLCNSFSGDNNLRTQPLSYLPVCPLFSTFHNMHNHQNKISPTVHKEPPSVPSYSSSPVLQTSYYMHIHYCIFPRSDTGQLNYISMDIPRSWNHKSYHEVHSVGVFRNWNRSHHNMLTGHEKDVE